MASSTSSLTCSAQPGALRPSPSQERRSNLGSAHAERRWRWAIAVGAAGLLAACGGGGSSAPGGATTPGTGSASSFTVGSTLERLWTTGGTYTASWRDPADASAPTFDLTVSYAPSADAVFEGSTRRATTQLVTFRVGGVVVGTDITTLYFSTIGSLQLWGTNNLGGPYSVFSGGSSSFPASGTPGSQGALGSSQVWTNASKTQLQYQGTLSWSVERHDDATAYICLNTTLSAAAPPAETSTESTCLRADASGQIVGARVSLTLNGQTVTFR